MSRTRVAIVAPAIEDGGGVPAVACYLHRVLKESGRYEPELVSVAMGSRDRASLCLSRPSTWLRGARVEAGSYEGLPLVHVGARFVELEFQRYRPRRALTEILARYDLVQVVAGTPAWAGLTTPLDVPVALQVATLASAERRSTLAGDGSLRRQWQRLMARVTARLDESALELADLVFVENQWMYDYVAERIGKDRCIFAAPGVDTDFFRPERAKQAAGPYLLSVGRLADPRKNIGLLVRAYAALRERLESAPPLVLAGLNGPTAADWKAADELGVREHIRFDEAPAPDELAQLYAGATAFVVSSDEEGLGIAILEAMASGLPVVSTDCGGPATSIIAGETGLLVPVGDAGALAEGLHALLRDPQQARAMGERGRERAVLEFSLAAAGARFLAGYDRLVAERVHAS